MGGFFLSLQRYIFNSFSRCNMYFRAVICFTRVVDEHFVLMTYLFTHQPQTPTFPPSVLGAAEWYVAPRLTYGRMSVFVFSLQRISQTSKLGNLSKFIHFFSLERRRNRTREV
jgi:hypothetical protein